MAAPGFDDEDSPRAPAPAKRTVAVALTYDPQHEDDAPKVVATGKGALAERILEVAFQNGVKVREDADLAEILSAVEVDSVIPLEAFMAVAEILAYVYRVNGRPLPTPPVTPNLSEGRQHG